MFTSLLSAKLLEKCKQTKTRQHKGLFIRLINIFQQFAITNNKQSWAIVFGHVPPMARHESFAWRLPHLPHDWVHSLEGVFEEFLLNCCPLIMPWTTPLLDFIDFSCAIDSSLVLAISIALSRDRVGAPARWFYNLLEVVQNRVATLKLILN